MRLRLKDDLKAFHYCFLSTIKVSADIVVIVKLVFLFYTSGLC